MSGQLSELDPAAIRKALIQHREAGLQFDQAWQQTIGDYSVPDHEREVYKFMRDNFRAAYYDDKSAKGRCLVPERDVSNAMLMAPRRSDPSSNRKRCRSGDDCDRPATRGRFGLTFCEYHGEELARLTRTLHLEIDHANPRKYGNGALSGLRKKAA